MSSSARRPLRVRRWIATTTLAGAVVALASCASVTPIGELLANSSKYDGKTVRVRGTVGESAGLLGRGGYELSDTTGTLTVLSETAAPPPKGTKTGVKGVFESLFTLGTKSLSVLREQSRF